jgi:hypothetical protein
VKDVEGEVRSMHNPAMHVTYCLLIHYLSVVPSWAHLLIQDEVMWITSSRTTAVWCGLLVYDVNRSRRQQPQIQQRTITHRIFTMDDWQDAAFSTRHVHNRTGRGGGKSKHSAAFDVRKTFASYEVKCPAWQKALSASGSEQEGRREPSLELYRLTEDGEGVVGELALPGVLHASVILAGSRESLRRTVAGLEPNVKEEEDYDDEEREESEDEEEQQRDRFETFDKNSFRSPKFWFRWSGAPSHTTAKEAEVETELGYIVFSGNDCRKFKGTINCESLKWKNVAITGHKIVARKESDTKVAWGRDGVAA